jgi:hypothetical protein
MRLVMPAEFIRLPARMKNGTGQQREAVDAAGHAVQDDEVRDARLEVRVDQRRASQRDEHGHTGQQTIRKTKIMVVMAWRPSVSSPAVSACCADFQPSRMLRNTRWIWRASIRKQPNATAP